MSIDAIPASSPVHSGAGADDEVRLWSESGGSGSPVLLLLHGLGACSSVWDGLKPVLASRWPGRWIAPDFRGHGRSFHRGPYGYSSYATDVASLLDQDDEVVVLGHSMGGVIGVALAAGLYGIRVRKVVAFAVKLEFQAAEIAKMQELGRAPVRWFDSREEAIDRYLKISGLKGLVDPDSEAARHGVRETDGKFRLAMDPRAFLAAGAPVDHLVGAMDAPLHLAAGSKDPMLSVELMRRYDPDAIVIPGFGHNVHVEAPEQLWRSLEPLLLAP
jgi:pimeloyl-ACP methyl ester carboxylesterase